MAQLITLEIPESLARKVQDFAQLTDRSIEAVVLEWLDRASTEQKDQPRTPGLLTGKLSNSCFDPLPEAELQAWE